MQIAVVSLLLGLLAMVATALSSVNTIVSSTSWVGERKNQQRAAAAIAQAPSTTFVTIYTVIQPVTVTSTLYNQLVGSYYTTTITQNTQTQATATFPIQTSTTTNAGKSPWLSFPASTLALSDPNGGVVTLTAGGPAALVGGATYTLASDGVLLENLSANGILTITAVVTTVPGLGVMTYAVGPQAGPVGIVVGQMGAAGSGAAKLMEKPTETRILLCWIFVLIVSMWV